MSWSSSAVVSGARQGRLTPVDLQVLPFGEPRGERADAARNREHLLRVVRQMIAENGVVKVTMDGLAERAGLGKGTVYRRFGTRAGIFQALLDDDEQAFQHAAMAGPPPLGPGADPVQRLIAFGRARIMFLLDHFAIARSSLERDGPTPARSNVFAQRHIRILLTEARHQKRLDIKDLDSLALQLTAAMEAPFLVYLTTEDLELVPPLTDSWQTLVEHLCQPSAPQP
jgi:AcrR family transcriptional regulator